ncbi:hypothetical protein B0T18DRAFT_400715 [Schizothecium vesticola]|uniref:BTB domain-containing protein n=1 Tax=Schizothecium vesticola TaxID=314040 RepID=A0AA40FC89_9PEZI|nr:hypothetical protein B0T18DRAFT_400715 [Schizothecium vesticola]
MKNLSDCQVKCGDRVWDVHKLVLCTRSKFFEKALCGSFMEAKTNVVTLPEHDPKHVEWALRCLYSGKLSHIEEVIRSVDTAMTAYRVCLELYQLGDYLDSDIICEAALGAMDESNKNWVAKFHRLHNSAQIAAAQIAAAQTGNAPKALAQIASAQKSEEAQVALHTFFEFRDSFVDCAKMAYSYPKRKSSRQNTYVLGKGHGVINLGPRGITTPFIHLMLFFKEHYPSSPASADLIRKLQEVPDLLGDMLITFVGQPPQTQPQPLVVDDSESYNNE